MDDAGQSERRRNGRWPATRRTAAALVRVFMSPTYRGAKRLAWRRPAGLFQADNHTAWDRYPFLFNFARERVPDSKQRHVLSFGCSTGEEVFSLRRYFPTARISGIDINPQNIADCRRRLSLMDDPMIDFSVASSIENEPDETYDVIFCMAVLRHGDLGQKRPASSEHLIRFTDFERMVSDFARCLKAGGWLFITHSNFRFCDTGAAAAFDEVCRIEALPSDPPTPIYDRDSKRMNGVVYRELGFRKAC